MATQSSNINTLFPQPPAQNLPEELTVKYNNKHEMQNLILWFIIIFIVVYILFLLFRPGSILMKEGDVQVVNQGKALLYTLIITIIIIFVIYIFQRK